MKGFSLKKAGKGAGQSRTVFKNGAMASVLTAAVLAAVILVNLLVGKLPKKFTQFDLSQNGVYSIGEDTQQLLAGVEQDVTFYYLAQTGQEQKNLTAFLDRYAGESKHVRWEQKDPALYPTFAAQYGAKDAAEGSIIAVCGERSKVIDAGDLYQYDYSNYYTTGSVDMLFDGEQQLTSALYYVTSGDLPVVYQLTGHGEAGLSSSLESALDAQNIELQSLALVSADEVPKDAAALILAGPTVDYTAEDVQLLRDYLDGGGSLLVFTDASAATPNLDALLAEYGLARTPGLVVEGDANHHARGYDYYLLPDVGYHEATQAVQDLYVLLPMAQAIEVSETENVSVSKLLNTSGSAYNKTAGYDMTTTAKEEGDTDGPFALAAAATRTLGETESKVIWVGSLNLLNQAIDAQVAGGNSQFVLGCTAWLCGQDTGVLIAAKSLSGDQLVVSAGQAALWGNLTTIALPALCLIAGAAITIRRRRR